MYLLCYSIAGHSLGALMYLELGPYIGPNTLVEYTINI